MSQAKHSSSLPLASESRPKHPFHYPLSLSKAITWGRVSCIFKQNMSSGSVVEVTFYPIFWKGFWQVPFPVLGGIFHSPLLCLQIPLSAPAPSISVPESCSFPLMHFSPFLVPDQLLMRTKKQLVEFWGSGVCECACVVCLCVDPLKQARSQDLEILCPKIGNWNFFKGDHNILRIQL